MSDGTKDVITRKKGGGLPTPAVVALLLVLAAGVIIGILIGGGNGAAPDAEQASTAPDASPSTQPTQAPAGIRPNAPVPAGSALTTLTTPPENTLAMIDGARLKVDARYLITFSPFGYGPPQGAGTLVVRILSAKPGNESAEAMDLVGQNLLAQLAPGTSPVTAGGTYSGTLTFRAKGDLLVPVLANIAPLR